MLKITLVNGKVLQYNMGTSEREQGFRNTWYSMQGIEKHENTKLRIKDLDGNTLVELKIKFIQDCVIEEYKIEADEKS